METFYLIFNKFHFSLDLILMTALYAFPLPKRAGLVPRLLGGVAGCFLLSRLFPDSSLQFYLALIPVFLVTWLCCEISALDALYCVCCGYATQHFYSCLYSLLCTLGAESNYAMPPRLTPLLVAVFAGTAVVFYLLFARRISGPEGFYVSTGFSTLSITAILLAVLVLSSMTGRPATAGEERFYAFVRLYDLLCCVVILWMQAIQVNHAKLQRGLDMQRRLAEEQKEQYALTRETIDIINRKCHDMKHQLAALRRAADGGELDRYLNELGESIQIYDSTIQTGSDVLDTVLTEKSLWCEARDITMTCVADGARLDFMSAVDVYAMFGNAIDNAVESVSALENREMRVISVSVWGEGGLVMIQVENPCERDLDFDGGLPASTKAQNGYHGFGLKSIQHIAEKYGGQMSVRTENRLFILRVAFPEA